MSKETKPPEKKWAGNNVIAKVNGKEIGPIYCVQVVNGIATLQGSKTYEVKAEDIRLP